MVKRPEGCRLLHIAKQIVTEGVVSYGTPEPIIGLEEITLTNNYAEGSAYSDNMQDTNIRKPSFIDISVVVRELSNAIEAKMMGKKYENGRKVTSASDSAPVFALLYQQTNSDGTYTNRVLYNCTLSRDEVVNTTVKDGIEYDTISISGKAIPLVTGELDLAIESDDAAVNEADLTNFFKKVILSTDPVTPAVVKSSK